MQPDRNETDWQKPKEQPSQAPYAPTRDEITDRKSPVVTLTPDAQNTDSTETQPLTDEEQPIAPPVPASQEPVRWQAHEYIHHERSPLWFVGFAAVVVALMAVSIFLIRSATFTVLIPVMAAALLVYSYRPPRLLDYTLSAQGLHINDRLYSFTEFKGFGVVRDGKEYSIMLIPTKRFRPGVSVYFPEEAGEAIVDMLGARLPMQELRLDVVDRIIRKLRI